MAQHASPLARRDFLTIVLAGGGTLLLPAATHGAQQVPQTDVWVIHGPDKQKLMDECLKVIDANGGFGRNAKTLALKVNAAWAKAPELGANTHPDLVAAFIRGAKRAGVSDVQVPEHPCNRAEQSFTRSGILKAVQGAGGEMVDLKTEEKFFVDTKVPQGKSLTQTMVARQFLEADAVVNMPVAKHHRAATLTMAMKNWMGAVQDRHFWHRNDLHQCIADFSTLIKPGWAIIDATRVILKMGPQGGNVAYMKKPDPNLLIVSRDQVAADAYATVLFDTKPEEIGYLRLAGEMGLGTTDLSRMRVHNVEAPA